MLLQAGQAVQNIQLQAVALGLTFAGVDNVNMNMIKRIVRLSKVMEPLCVLFVGYPADQTAAAAPEQPAVTQPASRKILMVVPQQGFQDQELSETKRALELAGVPVLVASTRLGTIMGTLGGTINADLLINQAKLNEYSAVVFVGGPGAIDYFNNPIALNLVRQAANQRKVVAAIGTAPTILANAGILRGVRVTGFLTEQARIAQGGAVYTGNPVEKDGLIVTATNALTAPLFVQAILEGLGEAG
jgi:protease I